jgi:hypothetical protein
MDRHAPTGHRRLLYFEEEPPRSTGAEYSALELHGEKTKFVTKTP